MWKRTSLVADNMSAVCRPQFRKLDDGDDRQELLESQTQVSKPALAKHESVKVDNLIRDPRRELRHVRRERKCSHVEGRGSLEQWCDSKLCALVDPEGSCQLCDSLCAIHITLMLCRMKRLIPAAMGLGYISAEQESVTSAAMPHLTSANGGISRVNYKRLVTAAAELFDRLSGAWWIPALLMRLFVGYFFMETGWAKIHNLDAFTTRFEGWGIPYPAFNAALSAYTEFLGGGLTILGLGMRFVSIPMIINMIVAILTVKLKNVGGLDDFAELDEPLYALSFVWLFFSGAGWLSIDGLIKPVISSWLQQNKSKSSAEAPNDQASLVEDPHLLSGHDSH